MADIKKQHFNIQPPRNSTKSVYAYLLIHPDWLKGSPGKVEGQELGGHADDTPEENAAWYTERLKNLNLIEVRGRIKLAGDTSAQTEEAAQSVDEEQEQVVSAEPTQETTDEGGGAGEDRKQYGVPRYIRLADGRVIDTRTCTVPKNSFFSCGKCGHPQDFRTSVQSTNRSAPVSPNAIQGYCPTCDAEGRIYGGRFFAEITASDSHRLNSAEVEWARRRDGDLSAYWPRETIPDTYMTHQANFALPKQGYTHWWKMFNARQLLVAFIAAEDSSNESRCSCQDVRHQALGGIATVFRNQCMFSFWHPRSRPLCTIFSATQITLQKTTTVEVTPFGQLRRG